MLESFRKNLSLTLTALFLVLLTGCQSSGGINGLMSAFTPGSNKYDMAFLEKNIIPGKTTRAEVSQIFGAPDDEKLDYSNKGNGLTWVYQKNNEGIDKYLKLAHKYVSTDDSLKLYEAQSRISRGQDAMNDISSVTGAQAPSSGTSVNGLIINFVDDVVKSYRLY